MSIVRMPRYELYWSEEILYEPVSSTLSLERNKKLRQFLHVVDNTEKDENKGDKCFKIKELLELVRANCNKIEPEVNHFIDEQTIPTMVSDNAIHKNHINGVLRL